LGLDNSVDKMISVCTTATMRPEILKKTFESFYRHMFLFADTKLYINIDPAGCERKYYSNALVEIDSIVYKYFDDVEYRIPTFDTGGSFPKAFIWVCSQPKTEYFFFLEDDWELLRPADLNEMINIMDNNPDLALLRLPRWGSKDVCRQWNKREIPWNGEFFELPDDMKCGLGFSGNPSLIRTSWMKKVLSHVSPDRDPEKQIKGRNALFLTAYRFGIFQHQNEERAISDIGSHWRTERKLKKDNKFRFVTWEKY